jgi:hypothetical protein
MLLCERHLVPAWSILDIVRRLQILRSLDEVGRSKAVGSLPLTKIKHILGENLDVFAALVDHLIQGHRAVLEGKGWAPESATIIGNLARDWYYDKGDPIMPHNITAIINRIHHASPSS